MIKNLFLLLALLGSMPVMAQKSSIDDSLKEFESQKGSQRVKTANVIMQQLLAEGFGDEITFDAKTHADTLTMTVCYYTAEYLIARGDYDKCISMAQQALPLTKGHPDYTWQSETLNLLMLANFYKSNYLKALDYARQSYALDEEHKDYERMSSTLNTTAGIYLGARLPWQAEQYIVKAIEADHKTADHPHANAIYGIAGEVYMGIGQYDKAMKYTQTAYELEMQRGNLAKAAIRQSQMASICVVTNNTARAHQLLDKAIPVLKEAQVMPSLGICYNTLADVMRLEGKSKESADYFRVAYRLFMQTGDLYNRSHSLQGLFRTLRDTHPDEAMRCLEHFSALKDTIYYNDMKMLLSNYSAQFHNDELSEQNSQLSEQNADVHKTNRTIIISSVVIVLLMLLALAFLIYSIRLKSRSNRFLLELQHTRENFFTNITHEFRTPLTVILGLSGKLQNNADEETRTSAVMIEREGSQLLQLINQLLDISKIQADTTQPDWRTDNIVAYLNMLLESFYAYADSHGVELIYAPQENNVVMDFVPDYIRKIVNNLVSNAVKYTKQSGHLRITTRRKGSRFILQVADDGIGMEPDQLTHIFEPFYQIGSDSQHVGTGVGLSLVKQIVTSISGTIEVASSRGKGTVFTVTLPVSQGLGEWQSLSDDEKTSIPQDIPSEHADAPLEDSQLTDEEQTRILIVEDNRDVAWYIGDQLKERYQVFYAFNGQIGLEKAQQLVPDLILTDLMMPQKDGLGLCREIRQSELLSHIPIIIITARSAQDDLVNGIKAGADAYLTKPFNAEELKVRVEKLLEQRRMLREKLVRELQAEQLAGEDSTPAYNGPEAQFIGRLTNTVYSLMGRGLCDIDSVASALCMSPSQLRRKVQAITGKTPVAYILQIRLSNAQRMLDKNPELSISDVAYRCGFSDQSHLSHAFQKAFGLSPSQWARRAK